MTKILAVLSMVSALGFAGAAFAGPVQLSNTQLDAVTAGGNTAIVFQVGGLNGSSVNQLGLSSNGAEVTQTGIADGSSVGQTGLANTAIVAQGSSFTLVNGSQVSQNGLSNAAGVGQEGVLNLSSITQLGL